MRQPRTTAGQRWLIAMGLALALAGTVFTGVLWVAWQRAAETRSWAAVPCTVLSSQVVPLRKSISSNVVFDPQVRYTYEVAGQRYESQRIKRVDGPSSDPDKAQSVRQRYYPGQRTQCYMRPGSPDFAILEHGSRAALYTLWFPLLFVVGGAVMAWRAWASAASLHV